MNLLKKQAEISIFVSPFFFIQQKKSFTTTTSTVQNETEKNQVLALFNKAVRKLCNWLTEVAVKAAEEDMETAKSKQKRLDTIK